VIGTSILIRHGSFQTTTKKVTKTLITDGYYEYYFKKLKQKACNNNLLTF